MRTGENNPSAKLSAQDVEEILASDEPGTHLAKRYGVSSGCIYHVRKGLNWNNPSDQNKSMTPVGTTLPLDPQSPAGVSLCDMCGERPRAKQKRICNPCRHKRHRERKEAGLCNLRDPISWPDERKGFEQFKMANEYLRAWA